MDDSINGFLFETTRGPVAGPQARVNGQSQPNKEGSDE